jgi:hypothetical protein
MPGRHALAELKALPRAWGGEPGRGRARGGMTSAPGQARAPGGLGRACHAAGRSGQAGARASTREREGATPGRPRRAERAVMAIVPKEEEGWVGEREGDGAHRAGARAA